jgi:putative membrane protein
VLGFWSKLKDALGQITHIVFVASWFACFTFRESENLAMVPVDSIAERDRLLLMARSCCASQPSWSCQATVLGFVLLLPDLVEALAMTYAVSFVIVTLAITMPMISKMAGKSHNTATSGFGWFNEIPSFCC